MDPSKRNRLIRGPLWILGWAIGSLALLVGIVFANAASFGADNVALAAIVPVIAAIVWLGFLLHLLRRWHNGDDWP